MSDRITTEEAERIAGENEREGVLAGEDGRMWGSRRTVELGERLIACAAVIRSLAAERDELRTMCKWTGEWLASSEGSVITHADLVTLLPLLERAALGEEGP